MALDYELKSWLEAETWYASGMEHAPSSSEARVLLARVGQSDYRLAEMLVDESARSNLIQTVRSRIARGRLPEAEQLLQEALSRTRSMGHPVAGSEVLEDLLIDLATVHYQSFRFLEAVNASSEGLRLPRVSGLAQSSLYQIRAAGFFELGEWEKALQDIQRSESLRTLYPNSLPSFYAEVFRVKVIARTRGVAAAEKLFRQVAKRALKSPEANLDTALTLIRTLTDLNRLRKQPIAALARSAQAIADRMGDELYSALSTVDLYFSESPSAREIAGAALPALRAKFSKVDLLLKDAERASPESESSRTLQSYAVVASSDAGGNEEDTEDDSEARSPTSLESILLLRSQICINLRDGSVKPLLVQERGMAILAHFVTRNRVDKDQLFRRTWGSAFHKIRHDAVLRNALLRLKRQAGVSVRRSRSDLILIQARVADL